MAGMRRSFKCETSFPERGFRSVMIGTAFSGLRKCHVCGQVDLLWDLCKASNEMLEFRTSLCKEQMQESREVLQLI